MESNTTIRTQWPEQPRSRAALYLKLVLSAVFWGSTYVAGRVIAHEAGPFSAAFLRFLAASGFLVAFLIQSQGKLPSLQPKQFLLIFVLGLTGVFGFSFFFFSGLKLITASRASLIMAICPAVIALLSSILLGERLGPLRNLGIAISLTGAAVVVSRGEPMMMLKGDIGRGELLILGCVASWSCYSLIGKAVLKDLSPLPAVTYTFISGGFCLLFPALREGIMHDMIHYSTVTWLCILYISLFGSAVAFIWYYDGIKVIGASRSGVFINIVPISSVLLAFFLLNETVDGSLVLGAILTISGVYLTNRTGRKLWR